MLFYELSLLKYYIVLLYCKWCVPGAIAGQPECERRLGQGVAGILYESFYFGILPESFFWYFVWVQLSWSFWYFLSESNWAELSECQMLCCWRIAERSCKISNRSSWQYAIEFTKTFDRAALIILEGCLTVHWTKFRWGMNYRGGEWKGWGGLWE